MLTDRSGKIRVNYATFFFSKVERQKKNWRIGNYHVQSNVANKNQFVIMQFIHIIYSNLLNSTITTTMLKRNRSNSFCVLMERRLFTQWLHTTPAFQNQFNYNVQFEKSLVFLSFSHTHPVDQSPCSPFSSLRSKASSRITPSLVTTLQSHLFSITLNNHWRRYWNDAMSNVFLQDCIDILLVSIF